MKTMLQTMIEEKGLDLDQIIDIPNNFGLTIGMVLDFIYQLPKDIQKKISRTFISIDFQNGDVMHYIKYLANGMATKF